MCCSLDVTEVGENTHILDEFMDAQPDDYIGIAYPTADGDAIIPTMAADVSVTMMVMGMGMDMDMGMSTFFTQN